MFEEFPIGDYAIDPDIDYLIIHRATDATTAEAGRFYRNDAFHVYQVLPTDKNGIVWGRVTENTDGVIKWVGMKVNNHPKVRLLKASDPVIAPLPLEAVNIEGLKDLYVWAKLHGYAGKPLVK